MNWLFNFFIDRTFGVRRHSQWNEVRKAYLQKNPNCAYCETKGKIISNHVHHVMPVWKFPKLELAFSNLITLCPRHHFEIGHFQNYRDYNPKIESWVVYKNNKKRDE